MVDDRIGYLLKRVQAAFRARMDQALSARELTTPQYAVLSILREHPGASNAELARRSFVTPQTMIRIVSNLESAGHVERRPHPTHGRVLQTHLTQAGEALLEACHRDVVAVEAAMAASLSPAQRDQLRQLLARCAEALESDA